MPKFDRFIGIDWSGSETYAQANGEFPIQIADLNMLNGVLVLVEAQEQHNPRWQQNRWSRTTVRNWLTRTIQHWPKEAKPILVGLDFAFSFPFVDRDCYFPHEECPTADWLALIARMRRQTGDDYITSPFVDHDFYQRYFKIKDREGQAYARRFRVCENVDYLRGHNPATVFNLIGGDQVGRGSISGMAVLYDIRQKFGAHVHVWPFDGLTPTDGARAVIVEVWPRLCYELLGVPPVSHRYPKVFRVAIHESNIPDPDQAPMATGENTGDAIISAAALHRFSADEAYWTAPQTLAPNSYPREGWIWGATAPPE